MEHVAGNLIDLQLTESQRGSGGREMPILIFPFSLNRTVGWMDWERFRCNINCIKYPNDCIRWAVRYKLTSIKSILDVSFHKLQVTQTLITTVSNQQRLTHAYMYIVDVGFSGGRGLPLTTPPGHPGVWEGIRWVLRNNFLRAVGAVFSVFHVLSKHFLLA